MMINLFLSKRFRRRLRRGVVRLLSQRRHNFKLRLGLTVATLTYVFCSLLSYQLQTAEVVNVMNAATTTIMILNNNNNNHNHSNNHHNINNNVHRKHQGQIHHHHQQDSRLMMESMTKDEDSTLLVESQSSVDYYACCGLGHRLVRMSLAHYISSRLLFSQEPFQLRSFWGWCGERDRQIEVYSYLFHPPTYVNVTTTTTSTTLSITNTNQLIPIHNEVVGFKNLVRTGEGGNIIGHSHDIIVNNNSKNGDNDDRKLNNSTSTSTPTCPCRSDQIESDWELYSSLRNRYIQRHVVDDFITKHNFHDPSSIVFGLHIRAGNGERGDFEEKGRGVGLIDTNTTQWVKNVVNLIQRQFRYEVSNKIQSQNTTNNNNNDPQVTVEQFSFMVYIATDTPSLIDIFRIEFDKIHQPHNLNVQVLDLPQQSRPSSGVLFGEHDRVMTKGQRSRNSNNNINKVNDGTNYDGGDDAIDDHNDDDDATSCLVGWTDTLTDMMILSHADIVIAGQPSSFVQSLPMSLAFGKKRRHGNTKQKQKQKQQQEYHKTDAVYCEVIPQFSLVETPDGSEGSSNSEWKEVGPEMKCYNSYESWCCNDSTWNKFRRTTKSGGTKILLQEFLKVLKNDDGLDKIQKYVEKNIRTRPQSCPRPKRGRVGGGLRDKCLPHTW